MDKKYNVQTYGCKVNSYDTGLLQKRLAKAGIEYDAKNPSVHILNTCAVTAEATKEALKQVRRLKAKNPESTVVVTGCAAQVDTDKFENLPGADLVIANSHKGDLENILKQYYAGNIKNKVFKSNIFKKEDLESGGGQEAHHTRSFLKIQDGCNSFCTYCVIPFARGKSRSIAIDDLVLKVNQLHQEGVNEVVLTGVHIGDYEDQGKTVEDLVEQLLLRTQVPRFRLTSFEPVEVNERLLDLYKDSRLCPHFHMSIQSAQSKVLKDMKRNYNAEAVEWSLNIIQQKIPDAFVGMDVIVGFPGETEEEFQQTYDLLQSLPWTRAHVFPYSERPGTYAARLKDGWPRHVIMERAKKLRALSSERYAECALRQVSQIKKVMILNSNDDSQELMRGLSRDFWNVRFKSSENFPVGSEVEVKIEGYDHSLASRMDGVLFGSTPTSSFY